MMSAPASRALSAISFRRVSTEIMMSDSRRMACTTGMTRRISSSGSTGSEPGRVDSPPTSMMSTPALIISRALFMASRSVSFLLAG